MAIHATNINAKNLNMIQLTQQYKSILQVQHLTLIGIIELIVIYLKYGNMFSLKVNFENLLKILVYFQKLPFKKNEKLCKNLVHFSKFI